MYVYMKPFKHNLLLINSTEQYSVYVNSFFLKIQQQSQLNNYMASSPFEGEMNAYTVVRARRKMRRKGPLLEVKYWCLFSLVSSNS